jgi:hypothetical protein
MLILFDKNVIIFLIFVSYGKTAGRIWFLYLFLFFWGICLQIFVCPDMIWIFSCVYFGNSFILFVILKKKHYLCNLNQFCVLDVTHFNSKPLGHSDELVLFCLSEGGTED